MNNLKIKFFNKVLKRISSEDDARLVFNLIFNELQAFVSYDRIGLALVKNNVVTLEMVKTTYENIYLKRGYRFPINSTSLQKIAGNGQARVINDLIIHNQRRKREISISNKLLLAEKIRSSLTVPLFIKGQIFGFIFFSSRKPDVYKQADINFFHDTAGLMAVALQKSLLITEQKKALSKLIKTNQALIQANHLNDEVLSIAAHDIKNLVNPIRLSAQALNRYKLIGGSEHAKAYLLNITEMSNQLANLVANILDISKLKQGKSYLEIEPFSPISVLNSVLNSWKNQAARKNINLYLSMPKTFPETIYADEVKFAQIFNNLLSNAIKFTDENGKISISASKTNDYYLFIVKDNGKGIVPERLQKLFDEFQQSSKGTKGERGTGFGLSIVKEVVRLHKGKIEVESQLNKGTTFKIYLPVVD